MSFDPASYVFSQPSAPTAIRASTVLPARRENVELRTSDGHRLVGELALPESGEVKATLITLHPLPTHGGFMDSHVYRKASYRLPALAGLRQRQLADEPVPVAGAELNVLPVGRQNRGGADRGRCGRLAEDV